MLLCSGQRLRSCLKIRLSGIHATISVNFLFVLIGIIDLSFSETVVVAAAGAFVQTIWQSKTKPQLAKIGFNVSALILASAGAYEAHRLVLQRPTDKEVLLALTIGASLYFVANTVLVAGVLSAVEGKPLGGIWRQCHLWAFPYYMVGGVLAAIMLVLERSMGWQVSLTLCPLMYLIYQWYRSFADVSSVRA